MNFLPLIESKREGRALTADQLRDMVGAFTTGKIPDYQMAAFLMAVFFRGLNPGETRALTLAMRDSGEVLNFPVDSRPVVDKHSSGGGAGGGGVRAGPAAARGGGVCYLCGGSPGGGETVLGGGGGAPRPPPPPPPPLEC